MCSPAEVRFQNGAKLLWKLLLSPGAWKVNDAALIQHIEAILRQLRLQQAAGIRFDKHNRNRSTINQTHQVASK